MSTGIYDDLTVVVMAKPAVPGTAKTRLIGQYTAIEAAAIHEAMTACVLVRLKQYLPGRHILALASGTWTGLNIDGWEVCNQGSGNLGQRINHVWKSQCHGPTAMFGIDSPDVPGTILAQIRPAIQRASVALGPVADGGYWTIAAQTHQPALLMGIDWGSTNVYHQTEHAAAAAGLSLDHLPSWFDVDEPADVIQLQRRLDSATEPPLIRLRAMLEAIDRTLPNAPDR